MTEERLEFRDALTDEVDDKPSEVRLEVDARPSDHSELGIASFTTGLSLGFLSLLPLIMRMKNVDKPWLKAADLQLYRGLGGLLVLFLASICVIGLGLGISGILQKNRRKAFAWLGIWLNAGIPVALLRSKTIPFALAWATLYGLPLAIGFLMTRLPFDQVRIWPFRRK